MPENMTTDELAARAEWRASMLKTDWVREAMDAEILADRKHRMDCVLSMIEPEWPDHLQPRMIVPNVTRGKALAEGSAGDTLIWTQTMGPFTSTWKSEADRRGYKYVITRVPVDGHE